VCGSGSVWFRPEHSEQQWSVRLISSYVMFGPINTNRIISIWGNRPV